MKPKLLYVLALVLMNSCLIKSIDNNEDTIAAFHGIQTKSTNTPSYYWHNNSKVYITETSNAFVILQGSESSTLDSSIHAFSIVEDPLIYAQNNLANSDEDSNIIQYGLKLEATAVNELGDDVIYFAPYYLLPTGEEIGLSELFLVKLKQSADYPELEDFANQHKVRIVKQMTRPLWYKLSCDVSSTGNALQMANMAYESGKFADSEAIFIDNLTPSTISYNDPEYFGQWNIRPDNSYSINLGDAHNITSGGNGVMVAVIDTGFQLDHPDIDLNYGWDATHRSPGAQLYEYSNVQYTFHGTGTAGIIGAKSNNNIGIVGIAPNATIFPISVHMDKTAYRSSLDATVDAIEYAVEIGADVISNSWTLAKPSQYITEAVEDALKYGRNGKGTVVVFSSGNYASNISRYPHADIPDIISVGNTNSTGLRSVSSNYGPDLDIVAPGTSIRTLKPGDSYYSASGTSFSCPHVSAVAALMLSVNPDLKQSEIGDILDITASKINTYDFASNPNKPNGTWNEQVGYGLLNCYDAVRLAYYYNENNYQNLIEFDYSDSVLRMKLETKGNVVIIWDWETKDISFINASSTEPKDTTIVHTFGTTASRRIKIAEPIAPGETIQSSSSALTQFELVTGNNSNSIDIKSINSALQYIRIIGGRNFASQSLSINGLNSLEELYLVQLKNSSISINNCPNLKCFGTSRYIWQPRESGLYSLLDTSILNPYVVGGGATSPDEWPNVPEEQMSPLSLSTSNCPQIQSLCLENAAFINFSFEGMNNLSYVYLSSQLSKIVGACLNVSMPATSGYYLSSAISTLPNRSPFSRGMIVIKAVNINNTEYIPVLIGAGHKINIGNICEQKKWTLVWDSAS